MRSIPFITLLFFSITTYAKTQDSLVNRIFNMACNMEYEQAENLLYSNKSNIDAFYFAVLEIDISYWKNVTGTNNPDYQAFENTLKNYAFENAHTFNQKGILLIQLSYQLRYELKRFKLFSAISTHKKTKAVFEELKANPRIEEIENPELFQLYNSIFFYFSNYLKAFGGKTKTENCKKALLSMHQLSESENNMTKTLASYFLGRTYLKYESKPNKGLSYFQFLSTSYPQNTKFPELLLECQNKAE